jgi:hypothetical protein
MTRLSLGQIWVFLLFHLEFLTDKNPSPHISESAATNVLLSQTASNAFLAMLG